ncbi:MAG: hypothetical protein Q9216_002647 [Gyalolechia sp. 2 TL-2023]
MDVPRLSILEDQTAHSFIDPIKHINEGHHVQRFLVSQAYRDIMLFVMQLNRAMFPYRSSGLDGQDRHAQSWQLGSLCDSFSEPIRRLQGLLVELHAIIDEVPPDPGPRRFGNIAFRKWYELVESRSFSLLQRHLPKKALSFKASSSVSADVELRSYLLAAFGSAQRLDYGTGHELSFLAFVACIWKLGGFDASLNGKEERGIVLGLLEPYLRLVRRLIKTYTLEPAGSHGVWGLDDHSFLPYLFGSAQYGPAISEADQTPTEGSLRDAPDPADVTKPVAVERERTKNMYFSAIGFIYDVKRGPFWEHSPMLYDISGVRAGWAKINKGMIKMYMAEVLSKFPIVQHFYFGSLFSWDKDPDAVPPPTTAHASTQPRTQPANPVSQGSPALGPPRDDIGVPDRGKTAMTSTPFVGTAAPWARQPTVTSPTASPSSTENRNISNTPRVPPSFNPTPLARTQEGTDMPPPTRAPWAKGSGK